jgi:hypothetical protein
VDFAIPGLDQLIHDHAGVVGVLLDNGDFEVHGH